jgi:methylamine dehydrogenase accessory protein MauD
MSYEALLYSNVILWLVVVALGIVVFGMVRQIGVLHERIAPMGALMNDRGPEVGEMAPDLRVSTLDGQPVRLGGGNPSRRSRLLLFVSTTCPVCKKLLPIAKSFAEGEKLDVVLVGDGDLKEQREMIAQHALQAIPYVNSPQVGMAFHVGKLPYAVLIDEDGVIRAKGLVNSREHLESLAIAKEVGYGSIQAYLTAHGYVPGDKPAAGQEQSKQVA